MSGMGMSEIWSRARSLHVLFVITVCAGPARADIYADIYADGRDAWTLLDRKLVNRQLFEQLATDGQEARLGRDLEMLAVAADGAVGYQQPAGDFEKTRFHGYYVLDTFVALRPLPGLDVNLNLSLLNPSASDGYRRSDQILAGVALHLSGDIASLWDKPLHLEFLALDLDVVTIGHGLMLEEVPLEGFSGALRYNDVALGATAGGRVFWPDDDLMTIWLSFLERAVELRYTAWVTQEVPESPDQDVYLFSELDFLPQEQRRRPYELAHYLGLSGAWRLYASMRLAAEYAGRLEKRRWRNAVLVRADFLDRALWRLQLHVGYQFRFYQKGFGPRDDLVTPTALPNVLYREDTYVTNSFEYLAVSKYYDQWSHTVMLEVKTRLLDMIGVTAQAEYWLRVTRDPRSGRKHVLYLPRGGRAPGVWHGFYYRAGIEVFPWADRPHRANIFITNKQVASGMRVVDADPRRLIHHPMIILEMEVFL